MALLSTRVLLADALVVPFHTPSPCVRPLSSSLDIFLIIFEVYVLYSALCPILSVDITLRHTTELCGICIIAVQNAA